MDEFGHKTQQLSLAVALPTPPCTQPSQGNQGVVAALEHEAAFPPFSLSQRLSIGIFTISLNPAASKAPLGLHTTNSSCSCPSVQACILSPLRSPHPPQAFLPYSHLIPHPEPPAPLPPSRSPSFPLGQSTPTPTTVSIPSPRKNYDPFLPHLSVFIPTPGKDAANSASPRALAGVQRMQGRILPSSPPSKYHP